MSERTPLSSPCDSTSRNGNLTISHRSAGRCQDDREQRQPQLVDQALVEQAANQVALPGIRMSLPGCCLRLVTSPMTSLVIRVEFCQSTACRVVETTSGAGVEELGKRVVGGGQVRPVGSHLLLGSPSHQHRVRRGHPLLDDPLHVGGEVGDGPRLRQLHNAVQGHERRGNDLPQSRPPQAGGLRRPCRWRSASAKVRPLATRARRSWSSAQGPIPCNRPSSASLIWVSCSARVPGRGKRAAGRAGEARLAGRLLVDRAGRRPWVLLVGRCRPVVVLLPVLRRGAAQLIGIPSKSRTPIQGQGRSPGATA